MTGVTKKVKYERPSVLEVFGVGKTESYHRINTKW